MTEKFHIQPPMFSTEPLPWFLKVPSSIPATYMGEDYIVFDFETTNLDYGNAVNPHNRLVSAAWYVSGTHEVQYHAGDEFDQAKFSQDLEEVVARGGMVIAHNAKFDIKWLLRMGLGEIVQDMLVYDTMLGEHIIRGNRMHMKVNLGESAQRYGCTAKAYYVDHMLKCGVCPSNMDPALVRARAVKDVKDTTRMFLQQREVLNAAGQLSVMATRCIFTPVLADIEMQGIYLAKEAVLAEYDKVRSELTLLETTWLLKYGSLNPRSTKDMAWLIYENLGFEELKDHKGRYIRNKPSKAFPNGAPKVDNGTLEKLEAKTPQQQEYLLLRKQIGNLSAKLTKTLEFFKGVVQERDGMFYGEFNQHITQTHRTSSNAVRIKFEDGTEKGAQLQNMPREYKRLVGAPDGMLVGEVDGSQLEFRVAAFLGQDRQAIEDIRNDVDRHKQTAMELYGVSEAEVTKEMRQGAKAETFKPLYGGMRGTPEQERYYKWFRKQFPELAATQESWTHEVLAEGSLRMPWGMKWYWPGTKQDPRSGYIDNTPSIYNYPVQSFATADIIPIAVTYMWHRARRVAPEITIFNTVHDSAITRFPESEKGAFQDLSIQCFTFDVYSYLQEVYGLDFNVPLGVGVTVGKYWGDYSVSEFELNVEKDGTAWYKG